MREKKFEKINEFTYHNTAKLQSSPYLAEITNDLFKAGSLVGKYFFFEEQHYSKHTNEQYNIYKKFTTELLKEFRHGSGEKMNYIVGIPGIGKTLFFKKGIKKLFRPETKILGKYFEFSIDFRNIDQKKDIVFYENHVYRELKKRATDILRYFWDDKRVSFRKFEKERDDFAGSGDSTNTNFAELFPVMYFCKSVYEKYNQPAIITFDNIDLSCETTQEHIRESVLKVHNALKEFMELEEISDAYRVFFVRRPELSMQTMEENIGGIFKFPFPNVLEITIDSLTKAMTEAAKQLDKESEISLDLTLENIINGEIFEVKTHLDAANYFSEIINHYLVKLWNKDIVKRLGSSQEFHCRLVNYNVRIFLAFLSDVLRNGGFKPFADDFNKDGRSGHYSIYDYLEMLIRGWWKMHPGNRLISKEERGQNPIVFNVFDTTLLNGSKEVQIKHFMLNIRIMQWFYYCEEDRLGCKYQDAINKHDGLVLFFDNEMIKKATKKLIHVGILYSNDEGENVILSKKNAEDIKIENKSCLALSDMGRFYLEKLICEFEYLYQMALSSLMRESHVNRLKINNAYLYDKEETVICFLESIFDIIVINFNSYDEDAQKIFDNLFLSDKKAGQLLIRMIDTFIMAMSAKSNRLRNINLADHHDLSIAQRSEDRLNRFMNILERAELLRSEVIMYPGYYS